MKKLVIFLSLSCLLAGTASAGWSPLTGDPVPLSSLFGEGIIVGDKEISEIDIFGFSAGGALAPDYDTVFVQGGQDTASGDYGLRFLLSWNAGPNQVVNANLHYKVSILPQYEDMYIKDVRLMLLGVSATGNGLVSVGETIMDKPFGDVLASLSSSKTEMDGGSKLIAGSEFAPVKEVWIYSKDISITGNSEGTAHLSEFYQFYSQIPEPATVCLLGFGAATLISFRRRRTG